MIGLMFFGAIALWVGIAIYLGLKIPKWLNFKRRWLVSALLIPLVFFAPVSDEIIAWPQMLNLCKNAENYRYNETKAAGKTVSKYVSVLSKEEKVLFPNVSISITEYGHLALGNDEPILSWQEIKSTGGFLKFPAGSSGTHMPIILPARCTTIPAGNAGYQVVVKRLNLQLLDFQPSK